MARVSPLARTPEPMDDLTVKIRSYKSLKDQIDALTKEQKALRDALMEAVQTDGYTDENGSLWIELDNEIDGVAALKRERRAKRELDEQAALEILTALGLEDKCYKTVRIVDEDAVYAALYNDELTDADIDTMFPEKITWALVLK